MSERRKHGRVEDFTNPFLVTLGVGLFILLFWIWANWGLPGAFAAGWAGERALLLWRA